MGPLNSSTRGELGLSVLGKKRARSKFQSVEREQVVKSSDNRSCHRHVGPLPSQERIGFQCSDAALRK
jgi:hypothetical protein